MPTFYWEFFTLKSHSGIIILFKGQLTALDNGIYSKVVQNGHVILGSRMPELMNHISMPSILDESIKKSLLAKKYIKK